MDTGLLTVRDLKASIAGQEILKGVSLSFQEKELTAIIGPSGCGKSTFIRCINRLHEEIPQATVSGRINLSGRNIYGADSDPMSVRRQIGMVFQKPTPFPNMTILENVVVGLKLQGGFSKSELTSRAELALKQVALWDEVKDKLHAPGLSLSGGQQQRLCLARTVIMKPDIILMDEPTSALDPIATAKIEELMLELKKEHCLIVVTHNMQQAKRVADRTAFFFLGELIESASTLDVFERPRQEKTRAYVMGDFG